MLLSYHPAHEDTETVGAGASSKATQRGSRRTETGMRVPDFITTGWRPHSSLGDHAVRAHC